MSYNERHTSTLSIGCLPAAIFGLVTGAPAAFVIGMGECVGEDGLVGSCRHMRLQLVSVALLVGAACLLITWATNRVVRTAAQQGRGPASGVVAGFGLAMALGLVMFGAVMVFH